MKMSLNNHYICSVCIADSACLISITQTDNENLSWLTKLTKCLSEFIWSDNFFICIPCTQLADTVYTFREMCLKSHVLNKQQIGNNNLNKVGDRSDTSSDSSRSSCVDDVGPENTDNNKEEICFTCDKCNETFNSIESLNEHSNKCVDVFVCYHCNSKFNNKDVLIEHLHNEHSSDTARRIDSAKLKVKLTPEILPKKSRATRFICEDCPEIFNTSKKLIEHAEKIHEKCRQDVKPFQCPKCGGRFASSSNLVQHKKYHEGNRVNTCSYCGKGFVTSSDLINHEKQHLNRREYKCDECPKSFNTHKDLRSHMIVKHRDPSTWKYRCEICDKRFHIKPNYVNHLRRHTGDKRFPCRLCEKSFVTKDELRKHMISHSNVRAFVCTLCPKEYKDKRGLDIHMTKAHNLGTAKVPHREKKHLCSVCPKAFYDRNKLRRHMCTHSGDRPYECDVCGKKFMDRSYMRHHAKTTHGLDKI